MTINNLCTTAELKIHLGIASGQTAKDSKLAAIIAGVSEFIQDVYCHQKFTETTVTSEVLDSEGKTDKIFIKAPVTSITSIIENETPLVAGEDYNLYSDIGALERIGGYWMNTRGLGSAYKILASYKYGYATVPESIHLACMELCGILGSEKLVTMASEGLVQTVSQMNIPPHIQAMLDGYKQVRVF